MKGLSSAVGNALNDYKSAVHIKKRDVFAALRAAAEQASIEDSLAEPEINTNSNAQDEAQHTWGAEISVPTARLSQGIGTIMCTTRSRSTKF